MYCDADFACDSLSDLITHLMGRHRNLKSSYFSCPACPNIVPLKWDEYLRHFRSRHLEIGVFEGYNRNRDAWSIALEAIICMDMTMSLDSSCVPAKQITTAGGYVSLERTGQKEDLVHSLRWQHEKLRRTLTHRLARNEPVVSFGKDLKSEEALVQEEYEEDPSDCVM